MDIRVDNMQQVNQTNQTQQVQQTGEEFKFTLMSSIEESGLQERLSTMMEEITMQGKKLGKHMDIRDMKHYRRLIKDFMNEMKMTKQEVKEEWKEMEGDPEVKSKLKQMQQQLLSKNVRKAVSESDVVIANPTHFAVALKYDAEKASAPMVNAKGEDNEAQIIKKIASDNHVPIVEDRIVARALYTNVEIGDIIPNEYLNVLAVIYSHLEKFKDYKG